MFLVVPCGLCVALQKFAEGELRSKDSSCSSLPEEQDTKGPPKADQEITIYHFSENQVKFQTETLPTWLSGNDLRYAEGGVTLLNNENAKSPLTANYSNVFCILLNFLSSNLISAFALLICEAKLLNGFKTQV